MTKKYFISALAIMLGTVSMSSNVLGAPGPGVTNGFTNTATQSFLVTEPVKSVAATIPTGSYTIVGNKTNDYHINCSLTGLECEFGIPVVGKSVVFETSNITFDAKVCVFAEYFSASSDVRVTDILNPYSTYSTFCFLNNADQRSLRENSLSELKKNNVITLPLDGLSFVEYSYRYILNTNKPVFVKYEGIDASIEQTYSQIMKKK